MTARNRFSNIVRRIARDHVRLCLLMAVLIVANGAFAIVMLLNGAWRSRVPGARRARRSISLSLELCAGLRLRAHLDRRQRPRRAQVDAAGGCANGGCPSYWASVGLDEENDERGVLTARQYGKRIEIGASSIRRTRRPGTRLAPGAAALARLR